MLFRTRSPGGRWGRWQPAAPEADDLPNRGVENRRRGWHLGSPYWTGSADALQYRTVGRVSAVRAFFVRGRSQGRVFRGRLQAPDFTGQPTIITRAQWHAPESIRRAPPSYADGVHLAIVHHTAGSNNYSAGQSASIVRAIMLYHVQGNGWNDIGYNFLVDKYGQVFEGRYGGITRPVIGAHAMGFNAGSVGVSAARHVRLDAGLACGESRARLAARLAPRSRSRRPALPGHAHLGREPALPAGPRRDAERDLRTPGHVPDQLPRHQPLPAAALDSHVRGADGPAEDLRAGRDRCARRAGRVHGAPLEPVRVDGHRPRRGGHSRRQRLGHRNAGRLDLGRNGRLRRPALHLGNRRARREERHRGDRNRAAAAGRSAA